MLGVAFAELLAVVAEDDGFFAKNVVIFFTEDNSGSTEWLAQLGELQWVQTRPARRQAQPLDVEVGAAC